MAEYRAYQLNEAGRIALPATIINADSDEQATERARCLVDGHDIELWQAGRAVVTLRRFEP